MFWFQHSQVLANWFGICQKPSFHALVSQDYSSLEFMVSLIFLEKWSCFVEKSGKSPVRTEMIKCFEHFEKLCNHKLFYYSSKNELL